MNGELAVNIDEEALFEVLATANFAAPVGKATVRTPAAVTEFSAEASSMFPWFPDPENYTAACASPSSPF